jgi:Adenine specific DNA methylase Mod
MANFLYYGDNLDVLRRHIDDEVADLVYLDPPFNSNQTYNVLFAEHEGTKAAAQIKAFGDTWEWNTEAERAYEEIVEAGGRNSEVMQAFRTFLSNSNMMAYLAMMAPRLVELRRVMKPTASVYLHCDSTASHYLKMLMDAVFGPDNFRNEIIWRRTGAHSPKKSFGPIHDTILFYSKTNDYYFKHVYLPYMKNHVEKRYSTDKVSGKLKFTSGGNILTGSGKTEGESGQVWQGFDPSKKNRHWAVPGFLAQQMAPDFEELGVVAKLDALYEAGLVDIKEGSAWPTPVRWLDDDEGQQMQDIWAYQPYTEGTVHDTKAGIDADVMWLGPTDPERLGYPTQKPEGLLHRIVRSSCPEGGVVIDPFCGCGTSIAAAQTLNRPWIGIDITHLAIALVKNRLLTGFPGQTIPVTVVGEPVSLPDAVELASEDTYQFQWWSLGLVGARPIEQRKGADKGIDGRLSFHEQPGGKTKNVILSVKGGHLKAQDVRDLRGVMERERAEMAVLISLEESTSLMQKEAATAGFYTSPWNTKHQRLQLLTIEQLLDGKGVDYPAPRQTNVTLKKARGLKTDPKNRHLF